MSAWWRPIGAHGDPFGGRYLGCPEGRERGHIRRRPERGTPTMEYTEGPTRVSTERGEGGHAAALSQSVVPARPQDLAPASSGSGSGCSSLSSSKTCSS